uniref:Large ribosomal subunit protein bL35c n=1 Tax=Polysiphonia sp. TaxID=1967842 RepID=A0A1Z1MTY3_9FLOR|nr:ribosomal protein L35 [Polysiphonia sp.]
MYKLKTKKSLDKRFRVTSSGKLLKRKSYKSHLLQKKSSRRKRRLCKVSVVKLSDISNFINGLPYLN